MKFSHLFIQIFSLTFGNCNMCKNINNFEMIFKILINKWRTWGNNGWTRETKYKMEKILTTTIVTIGITIHLSPIYFETTIDKMKLWKDKNKSTISKRVRISSRRENYKTIEILNIHRNKRFLSLLTICQSKRSINPTSWHTITIFLISINKIDNVFL